MRAEVDWVRVLAPEINRVESSFDQNPPEEAQEDIRLETLLQQESSPEESTQPARNHSTAHLSNRPDALGPGSGGR